MTTNRNLCADYVLAVLDPVKGKPVVDSTRWKAGLAGAAVVEAVLDGSLRLTGEDEPGQKPHRMVLTRPATGADAWSEMLRRADGHKAKDAVARVGGAQTFKDRAGDLFDLVTEGLVREEALQPQVHRVLGLVPTTRWRFVDPSARDGVRRRVQAAMGSGGDGDAHDAALAAILYASGALPHLFPAADRRLLKRQGKAVAAGGWGPEAVTKAINEVNSAVMAGVMAATIGGAAAASS